MVERWAGGMRRIDIGGELEDLLDLIDGACRAVKEDVPGVSRPFCRVVTIKPAMSKRRLDELARVGLVQVRMHNDEVQARLTAIGEEWSKSRTVSVTLVGLENEMAQSKLQSILQGQTVEMVEESTGGDVILTLNNGVQVKFGGLYASDTVKVEYRPPGEWKDV